MATAGAAASGWRDNDGGGARHGRKTNEAKVTSPTHGLRAPSAQRFTVISEMCMDAC